MIAPLLLIAASTSTVSEPVDTARFAIVIGVNHPLPGSDYDMLEFADDDALRFGEFFESIGVRTIVLAAPDPDTAARHRELADRAERPTREKLDGALARVEADLAAAQGKRRELFFVFSGHGSISSSTAFLHLFDDRFTRTDIFERVLKRMPAERIHVIIDSCHSYFLVNARGRRVAVAEDEESLDRYPSAGFLLSTSDSSEVQEWSGYRAGVFSHQILGALRGAADVDGDGVVRYDEVHAYVVAANLDVKREDARIQPYVRRPSTHGDALIDLAAVNGARRVRIPVELAGHFYVTDDAGTRVLDAHKAAGDPLTLLVPERRLFLHLDRTVYELEDGIITPISDEEMLIAGKGTIADEFRTNLFKTPLTKDFVRGLSAASLQVVHVHRPPVTAWYEDPITLTLLGSGGASLIAGAISTAMFADAREEANARPITLKTEAARARAEDWRAAMIGTYAGGGALLVAGVLHALLSGSDDQLAVAPALGGTLGLALAGRFE